MTSSAQASFVKNCEDIDELQQVFADVTAASPGRRRRLGAIHKSAIVLLTAFWEAFCEDIAAEALQHLVTPRGLETGRRRVAFRPGQPA